MTKREKQIFELIRSNPKITQNEISEKLNITRTSVAVHITHIVQKGYITGRQYIIKKEPDILVVGACNIDIQGVSTEKMNIHDSNVGKIHIGFGGVARNIAVNLKKLIDNVNFITALDKGTYGNSILDDLQKHGIGTSDVLRSDGPTSIYLSILDDSRDMLVGISDMDTVNEISKEFLQTKIEAIRKAEVIVIDANLSVEALEYIASVKQERQKIIADTVSIKKAKKLVSILDKIDILKTNKLEIEALFEKPLKTKRELKASLSELIKRGVQTVFVTLGSEGLIAINSKKRIKLSVPKDIVVKDVTGAGDIFTTALTYCINNNFNLEKTAKIAQCASIIKLAQVGTVPENFSIDLIEETMQKYYNESMFMEEN